MGIHRSNNPLEFDDIDGIIINESAPAPNVQGVAANTAIIVAQAQRGPSDLTEVSSIAELHEVYGKSEFGLNVSLKNKGFGRLKVVRVIPTGAAIAEKIFKAGAVDIIKFAAKPGVGAFGNNIKVKIEAGSVSGKKYTITDTNPDSVLPPEVYDNIQIAQVSAATFANSALGVATVMATTAEPDNTAVGGVALAGGSDGAVVDADYETAITKCEVENCGNVLFLDSYNSVRNGYLKAHAALTQDKMVILCGPEVQTVAAAVADVANFRDTDGRIIYAFPWVQTTVNGASVFVAPASFVASVISQTAPNIDPAYVQNAKFLGAITGLKASLSRNQYIQLKEAGILAFEQDSDFGVKIKMGVVTQIMDSSKVTILRRRMADFLTVSAAKYLKNYQNAPNSKQKRSEVKAALVSFVAMLEREGVLPSDSEVKEGKAKIIDTEALNTDASIAAGMFKILWRQRIFSSMRFIVLQAEIGESVVVKEGN